jgi:hypothetical protein
MKGKNPQKKSKIDIVTSALTNRFKFFKKGIGDLHFLENLQNTIHEIKITRPIQIEWEKEKKTIVGSLQKGTFVSPFSWFLPEKSKYGHVELILPKEKTDTICIHFAATGDQGFLKRRYAMAYPLAKENIASLILEIPYYGIRKPEEQFSLFLSTLSDFFKMSFGTVCEGLSLTEYCVKQGWKKIIVTGISMGGNVASFVGALTEHNVGIVPCISPHSPYPVFLEGMLSGSIDWKTLGKEFGSEELAKEKVTGYMRLCELTLLSPPKNPQNVIIVGGAKDGYVFAESVMQLHEHWKGSEIRWVNTGHVGAIIAGTPAFRRAIKDLVSRL